jgi:hypothetical protein
MPGTVVAGFQNTGFDNGVFVVPIAGPLLGGLTQVTHLLQK